MIIILMNIVDVVCGIRYRHRILLAYSIFSILQFSIFLISIISSHVHQCFTLILCYELFKIVCNMEIQKGQSSLISYKAHKANNVSSWWWDDCMVMWLHETLSFAIKIIYFPVFNESDIDGATDGRTDGPTDGRTDRPSYRDARTHLKNELKQRAVD